MVALSFDTSFLIDFQHERRRKERGPAHHLLEENREAFAYISWIAYAEYAEGFERLEDPAFRSVVESFEMLSIDRLTAERYAVLTRQLREIGRLIGTNDLWIASIALQNDLPLVTSNLEHFSRVPDLRLVSYR
jgi:predicted nucleic acid-binding protein